MVTVDKFGTMWQNITDWLKANADKIGLNESNIYSGHPLIGDSLPAPYIAIFALPAGDEADVFDNDSTGMINYTVFVSGAIDGNIVNSVINSAELAGETYKLLTTQYPYVYQHTKPQPETMHNDACIMSFEISSPYQV